MELKLFHVLYGSLKYLKLIKEFYIRVNRNQKTKIFARIFQNIKNQQNTETRFYMPRPAFIFTYSFVNVELYTFFYNS